MTASVSIVSSSALAAGSSALTPSYEEAAHILYDQPQYYFRSSDDSGSEFRDNSTNIDSQISFLSSTSILRRVIEIEGLAGAKPCQTFLSCAKIEVRSNILNSGVRVITLVELPEAPSFPQRLLFAAVGLALVMLLGGAGALMRELLTSGFMAKHQLDETLAVRVLASLNRLAKWSGSARMQTQPLIYLERRPLFKYSKAIRRLRALLEPIPSSLLSANPVLVTSAVPGEGKMTLLPRNDEFLSAGAQEELRRTLVRPFVARLIPVGKSVVPNCLKFCDSRSAAAAGIAAGIEHALVARTESLRLMVVQVNAGEPPDKIAAEILQSLFAARQAPASL